MQPHTTCKQSCLKMTQMFEPHETTAYFLIVMILHLKCHFYPTTEHNPHKDDMWLIIFSYIPLIKHTVGQC